MRLFFFGLLLLISCSREKTQTPLTGPSEEVADTQPTIAQRIGDIFEKVMRQANPHGANFMRRPVFAKAHGCVKAKFDVDPSLPAELRIGAFREPSYNAWIRFSNDGGFGADSPKSGNPARGMAIKLVGVKGTKILDGYENALTQDFVMENHPTFFVDTATEFLDLTEALLDPDPQKQKGFFAAHPNTLPILDAMGKNVLADPLDGQYYTPTEYSFGPRFMKYMAKPCVATPNPPIKPMTGTDYLRENLAKHLAEPNDACMDFWIQFRDPETPDDMPLDKATVKWRDTGSGAFVKFATLTVPKGQNINDPTREKICEDLSFTGWHATAELTPSGSLNLARREIYKRMATIRRTSNKVPLDEPTVLLLD